MSEPTVFIVDDDPSAHELVERCKNPAPDWSIDKIRERITQESAAP